MANDVTALRPTLTAIRGVAMAVGGAFAFAYPAEAVRLFVLLGGGILLVDGILNLASLRPRSEHRTYFWIGVLRSGSAIIAGLLIAFSSQLLALLSPAALRWLIGSPAIVVGVVEMMVPMLSSARASVPKQDLRPFWGYIASGGAYALFGLAIILVPPQAAMPLARIVAALMVLYALALLARARRRRSAELSP